MLLTGFFNTQSYYLNFLYKVKVKIIVLVSIKHSDINLVLGSYISAFPVRSIALVIVSKVYLVYRVTLACE